jgi:hypothetical protein
LYEDACSSDYDCLRSGRGDYCCFTKTSSYCQSNLIKIRNDSIFDTPPDCVIFEDNYSGKKIELNDGDSFNYLKYDKNKHGFRSVKLKRNCILKLCYENLFGQKSCVNHAFRNDEYKIKKQMPKFMSCICNKNENDKSRFIHLPVNLSILDRNKINVSYLKLHNGQFTIRFKINKSKSKTPFIIKLGSIKIQVSNDKIDLLTDHKNLFKQLRMIQNINLIDFKNKSQDMWISYKLINNENSFIKVGYEYATEVNTLLILNGPFLLENIHQLDYIEFDNEISYATIEYKSFDADPSPFLTTFYNGDSKRPFSTHITQLPNQVQILYNKLKNFNIDAQNDFEKIKYSFNNKNCVLNKNNKRIIFKKAKSLIVFEIWPANSNQIEYEPNTIQLVKIVHGSFKFEWLNQNNANEVIKEILASNNDVLWSTNEYFSKFRITNLNNDNVGLLIRGFYYLNSSSLLNMPDKSPNNLEQIVNRYRLEFERKTCNIILHQNNRKCSFLGTKCGSTLNYLLDNNINDDSLYVCNHKNGQLIETENCFKMNKTCMKDEGCFEPRKLKAFVKLNPAFNSTNQNSEIDRFSNINANIVFEQHENYVKIKGVISGLLPNSYHAIHIHEYGELGNNCRDTGDLLFSIKI